MTPVAMSMLIGVLLNNWELRKWATRKLCVCIQFSN